MEEFLARVYDVNADRYHWRLFNRQSLLDWLCGPAVARPAMRSGGVSSKTILRRVLLDGEADINSIRMEGHYVQTAWKEFWERTEIVWLDKCAAAAVDAWNSLTTGLDLPFDSLTERGRAVARAQARAVLNQIGVAVGR